MELVDEDEIFGLVEQPSNMLRPFRDNMRNTDIANSDEMIEIATTRNNVEENFFKLKTIPSPFDGATMMPNKLNLRTRSI